MTYTEALLLKLGSGYTEEKARGLLEFEGLDPDATWDPNAPNFDELKCQFYKVLLSELSKDEYAGVKSVSEGGFSISLDKDEKGKILSDLATESGCSSLIDKYNVEPRVRDRSNVW